ncbi:MAG: hypothetical protein R3274_06540 [Desulfobacterales bacterium]|nr:hypothetical protein [Desulfobacterales bacterium]
MNHFRAVTNIANPNNGNHDMAFVNWQSVRLACRLFQPQAAAANSEYGVLNPLFIHIRVDCVSVLCEG